MGGVSRDGVLRVDNEGTPVPVTVSGPLGQEVMAASVSVVVASNQSPVPVSAASLPLPLGASTAARQDTGNTALAAVQAAVEILDDWDEADRAKVNPIAGQAGVQGGAGASTALTQRVAIATDANAVNANDGNGNALASAITLPAGTERGLITRPAGNPPDATGSTTLTIAGQEYEITINGGATLAFTVEGGVGTFDLVGSLDGSTYKVINFYDRDVFYYSSGAIGSTNQWTVNVAALQRVRIRILTLTSGQADIVVRVSATALNGPVISIANLQRIGGALVDTNAGAASSGTQRVISASDDPAVTALQILDNIVSGSEAQVDVVAALPAGTNAIGKLAPNSGVDIGDVDVTSLPGIVGTVADDSPTPGAPVMVGGQAVSPDGTDPGNVSAEADVVRFQTDLNRRQFVNTRHARWWSYHEDSANALTDQAVQADPGDGYEIVITEIMFSTGAATACNIFFEEGASKILGPWYLEAVAGRGVLWRGEKHVTVSTALTVTTSAAIAHSLDVQGYIQKV